MKSKVRWLSLIGWLAVMSSCCLAVAAFVTVPAGAPDYLASSRLDPVALLAPPPLPDSSEQSADLATVIAVHNSHPKSDEVLAAAEDHYFSAFSFAPAIGPFLKEGSCPKTEAFFKRVCREGDGMVSAAKSHWRRLRPYNVDQELPKGAPGMDYSYPSGHSTLGTLYALILSDIFPDRRDAIMSIGRNIGWHRVDIAVHYPTDVYAGRVLAQSVFEHMKKNPAFQHDLSEVKKELLLARHTTKQPVY